jgi:hypothetical protein
MFLKDLPMRQRPVKSPFLHLDFSSSSELEESSLEKSKSLWAAHGTLNTEYGGSDAGIELYIIEQYHDYHMLDAKSVVTQAHEIQCMVKELALLNIIVPDKFVARAIIAKLPPPWRNFTTALKHKRVHMFISNLIASLDIEEKARAKDI